MLAKLCLPTDVRRWTGSLHPNEKRSAGNVDAQAWLSNAAWGSEGEEVFCFYSQ